MSIFLLRVPPLLGDIWRPPSGGRHYRQFPESVLPESPEDLNSSLSRRAPSWVPARARGYEEHCKSPCFGDVTMSNFYLDRL